jgi:hypothetical protein
MRDKQDRVLTDRQARVVRAMSHTYESAADIAHRAEIDNRGVGGALAALRRRGVVEDNAEPDFDKPLQWRLV